MSLMRKTMGSLAGIAPGPFCSVVLAVAGGMTASQAAAQDTVLVQPIELPDYDRGRNVSVLEASRPDYDALGIRRGAFLIFPRLQVSGGATDNVYATESNKVSDVFAVVAPSFSARSDWSRHEVSLGAGATLRRYASETLRNQDEWYVNALGRADLGSSFTLTAEGQASRTQESPFTGTVQSNVAALSSYQRRTAILTGRYTLGRMRTTLSYDYNTYSFSDIEFTSNARISQADRDRDIHRVIGQVEYALSPSLSVYGQVSYANTGYDRPLLTGLANRDSDAYRIIGGINFDLSAFVRGAIGIGYVRRNYSSGLYKDVSGPSVEARIEYFLTPLTTITLNGRRILDDSSIGLISAYFDNQIGVRVDHALRENLLVNVSGIYTHQDYIGSSINSDIFRGEAGAQYFVSHSFELFGKAGYGSRSQADFAGGKVNEASAEVGIVLKR